MSAYPLSTRPRCVGRRAVSSWSRRPLLILIVLASFAGSSSATSVTVLRPANASQEPLNGRLLLMLSTEEGREPRFQIGDGTSTQQIFGLNVEGWRPGTSRTMDSTAFGYPLASLNDVPAGTYRAQALLHIYETFHRSDGHVVQLPMDRGEGQRWNRAPGNLLSTPVEVTIRRGGPPVSLVLDDVIPPIEPVPDTRYIKHIKIQSERLTRFWGRPMHLGAVLLLPEGFDEHPEARYPLAIMHGHFPRTLGGFRETPPDPDLPAVDAPWIAEHCPNGHHPECAAHGYERVRQQAAHDFYRLWTGPDFPRVIVMLVQHANPYYDDSYAVNSANLGPYGDAITYELIPHVEQQFRGLGPWARGVYGGSTGGWEALAVQVLYPDQYNGAHASCPDPIDFRAYGQVNIYEDTNAYYLEGPWQRIARPGRRNYLGAVQGTLAAMNLRELALGTRGRSGDQWDIWEAVYSPVDDDGYPKRIWDKKTGVIDHSVTSHWREHYDLRHILERDWATLGPKLRGKLNIYVGEMDNYYLNNAVYLMERFLAATSDPPFDGVVAYGARDEHCWNGDPEKINAYSRLEYHQRFIPLLVERWLSSAPPGADTTSWRY